MKSNFILALAIVSIITTNTSFAQDDEILQVKMQFSSLFMGTNDSFTKLKGEQYSDDDNWTYYGSEYGLGEKAVTILHSKKDTTAWYCYIKFSLETELDQLSKVESGVFGMLNMVIGGGKIRGTENTENGVTRTDIYVTANDAWLGELVTDADKKTFHILLQNTPWQ